MNCPIGGKEHTMFHLIDLENWERKEAYRLYTQQWQGIYFSVTKKLDATATVRALKERGRKFVPAVIWLVSREVNRQPNFRMGLADGQPGYWDEMHPLYPVLNRDGSFTFHSVPYVDEFDIFYQNYLEEQRRSGDTGGTIFCGDLPENCFTLSVTPFLEFDSFTLGIHAKHYFAPAVEVGKYTDGEQHLLSVAVTLHHAVADMRHLALFYERLSEALALPEGWCAP